jgi:hypothetical protein
MSTPPVAAAFSKRTVRTWDEFLAIRRSFGFGWIFRGQATDWTLSTALERACLSAKIGLKPAAEIEAQLVRDFRRRYAGPDIGDVRGDMMYCLALMQHHGAPTRLLDCSYSPFVAAYFALECAASECFVWCMNGEWLLEQCRRAIPEIDRRNVDADRNDATFDAVYVKAKRPFVFPDNPLALNQRLIAQQGVFLVPGDVSLPFEDNFLALGTAGRRAHLVKLRCAFSNRAKSIALGELHAMNINRASLFPGLDGFAQSLKSRIWFYRQLGKLSIGERL